jgi:uncharacterized membrane protein
MPRAQGGRFLSIAVALLAALTLAGLLALWPYAGVHSRVHGFGASVGARVLGSRTAPCTASSPVNCRTLQIEVQGHRASVLLGPAATNKALGAGTAIRVSRVTQSGLARPAGEEWQFIDVDRHGSLLWLGALLLVLALLVIRWRGLLAAAGVGLSLLLMTEFLIPALLAGKPALLVALVSALAVMFITLTFTNGLGLQTRTAALGIASALLLTCALAVLAVHMAHVDGRTDEITAYLGSVNPNLSLQGIVLAGMIVGALGVLADTAVTQASAVMALRRANPGMSARRLYRSAFTIGRDHLSATIHTLVLAYVGASLPLLLITRSTGVDFIDAINTQDIAQPILAAIVGCIGLVCAVPLTTAFAAAFVSHLPARSLPAHTHGH